ncbi:MAG TPA: hypothetical protein VG246_00630 [Acidimicrobiales bacterium]|nr:hypothetical protein [Acidimicrobiales bacterium]
MSLRGSCPLGRLRHIVTDRATSVTVRAGELLTVRGPIVPRCCTFAARVRCIGHLPAGGQF